MSKFGESIVQFLVGGVAGTETTVDDTTNKLPTTADLNAGTALVGKVGLDQTTPGTTESVTVATAQGAGAAIGATTGAAIVTDVDGTIQRYLRGLVKLWIAGLAAGAQIIGKVGIDQTTPGTTDSVSVATGQGAGATIGTTADAAVVTDANGTVSAKLRGIIKLLVDMISVKLNDGSNALAFVSHEGTVSIPVTEAHREQFYIHLDAENIGAATGFMLIDLSDTTNWPHTNTGHIVLQTLSVDINADTSYRGDISLGFLSDVDGTNGDLNEITTFHYTQGAPDLSEQRDYRGGINLQVADWFGPTTSDSTVWQTDVDLQGPDGATSYPSGDGDFVLFVSRTAGNVDVGITALYETEA